MAQRDPKTGRFLSKNAQNFQSTVPAPQATTQEPVQIEQVVISGNPILALVNTNGWVGNVVSKDNEFALVRFIISRGPNMPNDEFQYSFKRSQLKPYKQFDVGQLVQNMDDGRYGIVQHSSNGIIDVRFKTGLEKIPFANLSKAKLSEVFKPGGTIELSGEQWIIGSEVLDTRVIVTRIKDNRIEVGNVEISNNWLDFDEDEDDCDDRCDRGNCGDPDCEECGDPDY